MNDKEKPNRKTEKEILKQQLTEEIKASKHYIFLLGNTKIAIDEEAMQKFGFTNGEEVDIETLGKIAVYFKKKIDEHESEEYTEKLIERARCKTKNYGKK